MNKLFSRLPWPRHPITPTPEQPLLSGNSLRGFVVYKSRKSVFGRAIYFSESKSCARTGMLLRIAQGVLLASMQSRTTAATSRIDLQSLCKARPLCVLWSGLVVVIEADKLLQNFKNVVFLRQSADYQQWERGHAWGHHAARNRQAISPASLT
jgi:hypothetical protein